MQEKDEEIEVYKSGMEQALMELEELKLVCRNAGIYVVDGFVADVILQSQGDADRALDTQIDDVLHSSVAKINDIVDSVLQSGIQRVDDALYELDSSMQAGNQNASPSYVLSQIEKASASATEFSTAFNNYIADGPNSAHAEIIRTVSIFSGSTADVLSNSKGLLRFATDDKKADQLTGAARQSAQSTVQFFRSLQSFRLEGLEPLQRTDVVINNNHEVLMNLQKLSKLVDAFAPKSSKLSGAGDLGDIVDRELTNAANAIEAAAERLAKLKNKPRDGYSTYELRIHDCILEASIAVTTAIAELIKAATASQQEIVREGRGSSSRTAFYKKNNRWTEGLISAAKAVANSTNTLIETADGVLSGRNSPEQLIVASNDVAASTAQLVAASRVKATFMSKTQDRLETASKAVGAACRSLVRQVQSIIAEKNRDENEAVDYTKLSGHEFKVREMEQQVCFVLCCFILFFVPFYFLHAEALRIPRKPQTDRCRHNHFGSIPAFSNPVFWSGGEFFYHYVCFFVHANRDVCKIRSKSYNSRTTWRKHDSGLAKCGKFRTWSRMCSFAISTLSSFFFLCVFKISLPPLPLKHPICILAALILSYFSYFSCFCVNLCLPFPTIYQIKHQISKE